MKFDNTRIDNNDPQASRAEKVSDLSVNNPVLIIDLYAKRGLFYLWMRVGLSKFFNKIKLRTKRSEVEKD